MPKYALILKIHMIFIQCKIIHSFQLASYSIYCQYILTILYFELYNKKLLIPQVKILQQPAACGHNCISNRRLVGSMSQAYSSGF